MAFIRTRIIKGRPYEYLEERWREGGKVRSRSRILRRRALTPAEMDEARIDRVLARVERMTTRIEAEQRARFGETAAEAEARRHREHLERLHAAYGLRVGPSDPVPIDKERLGGDISVESQGTSIAAKDASKG